jgi:hypothetical protein
MNGGSVARGLQVGAVHPLGIRKISKTNMLINPLENVRHPNASTCCLCCTAVDGNGSCLGAFPKLRKATVAFVMSRRPSAWKSWAPTGRIFMKFDI